MIVGLNWDALGGLGYASKENDSSISGRNCRNLLVGEGDDSTKVGFCLLPDRAC